jgi:hypothetical protein
MKTPPFLWVFMKNDGVPEGAVQDKIPFQNLNCMQLHAGKKIFE